MIPYHTNNTFPAPRAIVGVGTLEHKGERNVSKLGNIVHVHVLTKEELPFVGRVWYVSMVHKGVLQVLGIRDLSSSIFLCP